MMLQQALLEAACRGGSQGAAGLSRNAMGLGVFVMIARKRRGMDRGYHQMPNQISRPNRRVRSGDESRARLGVNLLFTSRQPASNCFRR